jgi:predicted regulator of Ras-like GTPase activity (Roadblock/LC7/MglB family)
MPIPFLDLFKKAKAHFQQPSARPEPTPLRALPAEKPSSERLSKTVLPNMTRTMAPPDPFRTAATSPGLRGQPGNNAPSGGRRRDLPPAVAFALEPKVERAISLRLSDILGEIPQGYIKPVESFDANRPILLKASEVEKGMSSGQPSVALTSIYEQVPEIFLRSLSTTEPIHVALPFDKVLEQFNTAHVRSDQVSDQAVSQVETPILQVAIEDTQRFGTTMQPLQTSAHPPVKVEPATAKTLSDAEPEPTVRERAPAAPSKPRGIPLAELGKFEPPSNKLPTAPQPARIPFHLPPNGTGAPASERVPASSGPPVPTPPMPTAAGIPFKVAPPCQDLRPKTSLVPEMEPESFAPAPKPRAAQSTAQGKIALPLLRLMRNLPAFQLNGDPSVISENVRVEFPLSLIEPQLISGRVAIPSRTFHGAMPAVFRELFVIDPAETPVLLPLQEVLHNMPAGALKMREDQEQVVTGELFETPFSLKAKEDAERFNVSGEPVTKPDEVMAAAPVEIAAEKEEAEVDEKIAAKEMVARACALPGVIGCAVTFSDGLILAGNIPAELGADGLSAMAPSLLQRIEKHMLDTKLGSLNAMTLHCAKSPVTFFMQGNICLTAVRAAEGVSRETHEKLSAMARQLSRTYAQPENPHVDH